MEEEGRGDLSQAVHYLTVYVMESQEFMIGVHALATASQKVDKNPNADVSAKDAQDFVRSCMTIFKPPALLVAPRRRFSEVMPLQIDGRTRDFTRF